MYFGDYIGLSRFKEKKQDVLKAINEAEFIALDTEFTGLGRNKDVNFFDTESERYEKIRDVSSDFGLLQIGLTMFKKVADGESYEARSFSFPLIRRKVVNSFQQTDDHNFIVQPSALLFLHKFGFDFNRWLAEGLNYLNVEEEQELDNWIEKEKEKMNKGTASFRNESNLSLTEDKEKDEEFSGLMKNIENFLENEEKKTFSTPIIDRFMRRRLYQEIESRNLKNIQVSTEAPHENTITRFIKIEKVSLQERESRLDDIINETLGFTPIFKHLITSGKPLVGHNCFLDFLHLVNAFVYKVPEVYHGFRKIMIDLFPRTYDTKMISSLKEFGTDFPALTSTNLGDLYETMQTEVFNKIKVTVIKEESKVVNEEKNGDEKNENEEKPEEESHEEEENEEEQEEKKNEEEKPDEEMAEEEEANVEEEKPKIEETNNQMYHDAGYDSFITGFVFLQMHRFLNEMAPKKYGGPVKNWTPFRGKFNLGHSYDLVCYDMENLVETKRDHVFHLQFPTDWKKVNIIDLFSQYGNVSIGWINSTSAFVALSDTRNVPKVLKELVPQSGKRQFQISTYNSYRKRKYPDDDDGDSDEDIEEESRAKRVKR